MGHVARQHPLQVVNYLRKTVNFNDAGISSGVPFAAYLPAGAQILDTIVNVITAFNAGTTNVLTVGQNSSSYNDIVGSSDVTEGTPAAYVATAGAGLDLSAGDALPYVKYAQTGTAATTGKAVVVITYVPNNDL